MLITFYAMMGNPPDAPGALNMMAEALASAATRDQINQALHRCSRECRYPVRLPDIFQRIPGYQVPQIEAEMRAAWDVVEGFVSTWLRWNCERTSAYIEKNAPQLSQRILDSVRRSGGWTVYLRMTDSDFPFVQKRFFDEYEAWTEVEFVIADPSRQLVTAAPKQLPSSVKTESISGSITTTTTTEIVQRMKPKSIPEPLTDVQLRDRRALLKQQLDQIGRAKRKHE